MREPRWVVEKKWDFSVGDHVLTFPLSVRTLSLAPGLTIFSGPSGEMAGRLWQGEKWGRDCYGISLTIDLCPSHLKACFSVFRPAIHRPHRIDGENPALGPPVPSCHCSSSVIFDFFLDFSSTLPRQFLHGLAHDSTIFNHLKVLNPCVCKCLKLLTESGMGYLYLAIIQLLYTF